MHARDRLHRALRPNGGISACGAIAILGRDSPFGDAQRDLAANF
jgi:hypothetical protein